jgi:hypothetical protein
MDIPPCPQRGRAGGDPALDPYTAPTASIDQAPDGRPPRVSDAMIHTFVIVNFLLGGVCLLWCAMIAVGMTYGLYFSGDTGTEPHHGLIGLAILGSPSLVGLVVYPLAGFGLWRRRNWG